MAKTKRKASLVRMYNEAKEELERFVCEFGGSLTYHLSKAVKEYIKRERRKG